MLRQKDIITTKQKELAGFQNKSVTALNIVTATIGNLEAVNEGIDVSISEINAQQKSLNEVESGLTETKARNKKIIDKFKALIEE